VGDIFKTRLGKANDKLEQKVKKVTGTGFDLKRKREPKRVQFQGKR